MKRSRSIRLVLLGSTGLLALAGCDQADPLASNDFFRSEQECARASNPDACRQAAMDAREQHARTAPAFASREACEARFGAENCAESRQPPRPEQIQLAQEQPPGSQPPAEPQQTAQTGGSWFLPLMMGYMMGRSFGGAPGLAGQPVYRDVRNTVYSGDRTLGRTSIAPPPRPATNVARGGFGRTGTGTVSS